MNHLKEVGLRLILPSETSFWLCVISFEIKKLTKKLIKL